MATAVAKVTWLLGLYRTKGAYSNAFKSLTDSKSTTQLRINSVFLERTKHVEIDYHFIWNKIKA